jgi:hypothetical protein
MRPKGEELGRGIEFPPVSKGINSWILRRFFQESMDWFMVDFMDIFMVQRKVPSLFHSSGKFSSTLLLFLNL